jgi:hypothetical protein
MTEQLDRESAVVAARLGEAAAAIGAHCAEAMAATTAVAAALDDAMASATAAGAAALEQDQALAARVERLATVVSAFARAAG